ncbi:MAG: hypothetical protein WC683_01335 [bacterium]
MPRRGGYQIAKMSDATRRERDRLIGEILAAARALYDQRLVQHSDLIVAQDVVLEEMGHPVASTKKISNESFYALHPEVDYRLEITLVVRGADR